MTKVMTIVGTRPEIIRLSRVVARLDESVDHVLVHTGQNYDYELNEIFFEELGLRKPDHFLNVDTSSLGTVLGETLIKTEEVLRLEQPDAVLILGDTNSAVAALMAKRMRIPVYHMEAGNRCFDENVPEETNRRMVDHVADFNLVYTEHARRNLLGEGIHPRRILLTGSPMREVLDHYSDSVGRSQIVSDLGLEERQYLLVSAHREENVDNPSRLGQLLDSLVAAHEELHMCVLVSTHPRTRKRIDGLGRAFPPGLIFHKPLGFIDYVRLQIDAYCVLSDSGTISEESSILRFPAVTLRDAIERPEALDSGSIIMSGVRVRDVLESISLATTHDRPLPRSWTMPSEYAIQNTAERTVRFIVSTAGRHREWSGLRDPATS